MTREEKQLLLKDLCARLPYRPLVQDEDAGVCLLQTYMINDLMFENPSLSFKPYLRPMSSMTEEEEKEWEQLLNYNLSDENEMMVTVFVEDTPDYIDWFNAHHFDYRNLIEKGLALEAPEEMYKTE